MSGIYGWWGERVASPQAVLDRMAAGMSWAGAPERASIIGDDFAIAAVGASQAVACHDGDHEKLVLYGHPQYGERDPGEPVNAVAQRVANGYRNAGVAALDRLCGDYALALIDLRRRELVLMVDRMGVRNVVWQPVKAGFAFASCLDALGGHPFVEHRVAAQSLFDYLYFHAIPGPRTIFERSHRLLPAHRLVANGRSSTVAPYWSMRFAAASQFDEAKASAEFRDVFRESIGAFSLPSGMGTFLSGGTDSSSVTGLYGQASQRPVSSFSIGFRAEGYDEMAYARIAAAHFATDHHEYYVTPEDVATAVPRIGAAFDGPFGNASAVPTYFCAKQARESGVSRMLAGDGGDELFGGNARYAVQHKFELYGSIPSLLRRALIERVVGNGPTTLPLLRKARSYIAQANTAMPERYESYNLLQRLGPADVLDPSFLQSVDRGGPLADLTEWWNRASASALIDRMLALDFKFTLADNDLPKVTRMCDHAGVDVAFPLLHDRMVAFSGTLPPGQKLSGTRLRPFFKSALRGVLPDATIAKQKHGFGLPVGPWLASHARLNAMMRESMESLGRRGFVRRQFIADLVERRLAEHPGYYGTMLWVLMMLEQWLQRQESPGTSATADLTRPCEARPGSIPAGT